MAMTLEDEIRRLVEEVYRYGVYRWGGRKAIGRIAEIGGRAIPVVRRVMQNPPKSDLHPRDLADSTQAIFSGLASTAPDALIDLLEEDSHLEMTVIWALGNAKGKRSLDALLAALKHKDKWVRWAAAESLIRRRSKRAVDPLLDALRDRCTMVKVTVVDTMVKERMYRKRRALKSLHRIVASQSVRKHSPGLWERAQQVIDKIEQECPE
jgi:HEAT repeat protein